MGTRIFVGNLSYGSTEEGIGHHFDQFGIALKSARIIIDRDTGRSRGFAFVELADESQLEEAVRQVDGSMMEGRPLAVREAHDKPGPGGGGAPRGGFGGPRPSFGGAPAIEARRPMGDSGPPRDRREPGADGDFRGPREPGRGFGGPPPDRGGYGGPPPDRGGFGGPPPDRGGYGGPPADRGGYGGPPSGPRFGGGPPAGARNFGPPAGPGGKRKPKDRDREGEAGRGRGETEKRRRGFHGGRGYTEYEDDDE